MADVRVSKPSSEERSGGQRGLMRRGQWFPSVFSLYPRDFFGMSPLSLMRRLTEDMDRAFSSFWGEGSEPAVWSPPIEVTQRGGNMIVHADLPGLDKDDVKVEVTDEGLVIQGERKRQHEEQREGYYRSERSYGRFYRLIPLPEDAILDQARAQFNNGVLEVSIPVPEAQRKRREIPVGTESGQKTKASGGSGS